MSKWFFLAMATLYGALLWYCILTGKDTPDAANTMFVLHLGIFSIMHLVDRRAAA